VAVADFNGDGLPDLVVHDSERSTASLAILLGRGDGTFLPERVLASPVVAVNPAATVRAADLNGDGHPDLVIASDNDPNTHILLGNGDGTFRAAPDVRGFGPGLAIDVGNGDGILDLVRSERINDSVSYALGRGDGTFEDEKLTIIGQSPLAVAVADVGSAVKQPDGTTVLGPPDGHPDLIVAASGLAQPARSGPPEVVVLPGLVDAQGQFNGFDDRALHLAGASVPLDVDVADVNHDGALDVVVMDREGVRVIYGQKPAVTPSDSLPPDPHNLGTVVHVVEPTLTIVPGHEEEDYTLTVPTEAAAGAGDEVLDFSGDFQATSGAGITMQVSDSSGNVLGSGERFRVRAPQGANLTLRVFGVTGPGGSQGAGAYTLDIDVLPQVVSVQAQPLLPGASSAPGGPTASLVVTLQGDRLDPTTAQNAANYTITWAGPDGLFGTADDQVIPVGSVVYDPSSNVNISNGTAYPTAVRQTLTFLFSQALPAGSYQVQITPAVQTAAFNAGEAGLLSPASGFTGHPVVSLSGSQVNEGSRVQVQDLVLAAGALGDFSVFGQGTPFLGQLHDDLGAVLDATLTASGDSPQITPQLIGQVLSRFAPAVGSPGQRPERLLALWLDPMSPALATQSGNIDYTLGSGQLSDTVSDSFVAVAGNVEVIVVAVPADGSSQSFTLSLSDVPAGGRGGVVLLGESADQTIALTDAIRGGTTVFNFGL
jgi:hypothetical protein